jgi:amidase
MNAARASRRDFLRTAAVVAAAAPLLSRRTSAATVARGFDPDFGSATDALAALRAGGISSKELTEHVFARIREYNPKINAFVTLLEEQALAQARQADVERARGRALGSLHGLPVLVKDSFETAGVRTTSGSAMLANYVPQQDAEVVARLKAAGAILIGKTNLPEFASDWQSYNDVAGTTNNPWDVTRTPGGSTGGGAAALAAGRGFLEIGSDIAGSIRVPSHFCGVYGHKPTFGLEPLRGHIPPPPAMPGEAPAAPMAPPMTLPVAGPLARSAADLRLELKVLAGPSGDDAVAYRWTLPEPRHTRLREYRVGMVLDDPFCPLDAEVAAVLAGAVDALRRAGVQVTEGWPPGFEPRASLENYLFLLGADTESAAPPPRFAALRKAVESGSRDPSARGATSLLREWSTYNGRRLGARAIWREYFRHFDAFLLPVAFVAAFPHDHHPDMAARKIATAAGERAYWDMADWIMPATLTGCPATAVPVGRTAGGLPVGLQVMGPYLEDATPIDFAMKMEEVTGGFVAPREFARRAAAS